MYSSAFWLAISRPKAPSRYHHSTPAKASETPIQMHVSAPGGNWSEIAGFKVDYRFAPLLSGLRRTKAADLYFRHSAAFLMISDGFIR